MTPEMFLELKRFIGVMGMCIIILLMFNVYYLDKLKRKAYREK